MARLNATQYQRELLARLMRAEAEADGDEGMMLVGMVGINRVLANCAEFKNIHDIEDMVYQSPGGFEAILYSYFYQRPRENELRLVDRLINEGERFEPGSEALWFFDPGKTTCPATWWGNWNAGRFGDHCFYYAPPNKNCTF